MTKKFILILICCAFVLNLAGCKKNRDLPENQVIKYNLGSEPRTLDPQICNDPAASTVVMNIFEGLVRLDADDSVTPGVALRWETSADGLVYTFYLRPDAVWSDRDKTPVTAQDFEFGLRRAVDKATNSPRAHTLYCIKNARNIHLNGASADSLGVSALDEHTLAITLEEPTDNFLPVLASAVAMPCNKAFWSKTNGQYGLESSTILGNGPFQIKAKYGWDHYNSMSLVVNKNYHGENKPVPAGVSFSLGGDVADVVGAIDDSSLDAAFLPQEQIDMAKEKDLNLAAFRDTLWGLSFNAEEGVLSNPSIRLGFLMAMDREYMLSDLPQNCEATCDIVPEGLFHNGQNFRSNAGKGFGQKEDATNAKAHLELGIKQLGLRALPSISILCVDSPNFKTIVNNIIEMLNTRLGYYFNMEPVSKSSLLARIASGNFQIAFAPIMVESGSAFDFLDMFRSNNKKNISNFKNIEYDKLLNAAITSRTSYDSINCLARAEKILSDAHVFYPMFLQDRYFACSKKLSGIIVHKYNQGIDFIAATKIK